MFERERLEQVGRIRDEWASRKVAHHGSPDVLERGSCGAEHGEGRSCGASRELRRFGEVGSEPELDVGRSAEDK